jgi:tripartite-type tricarboxylate transporter receptor subunit TctC
MKRLIKVTLLFLCIMGIAASNLAAQETYPSRPVTLTQAYAAGGTTDLVARSIGAVAPKYFREPIIVVAKPGGGGLVALQAMAAAKPDGHYIHLGRMGDMVNAAFIESMPFDMEKDFIPVSGVGNDELVVTVSAKTGWKSIEDLIAAAKKDPGKIKFGAAGTVASGRLVFEAFAHMLGIDIPVVPFKGSAPAAIAVAGGHIPVLNSTVGECLPHVQRGDLIPIMMMGNRRVKEFPNCPIPSDKGWKFDMTAWHAVFVAKGVPPAVIAKLESVLKNIVADPDYIKALDAMGTAPIYTSGKDFAAFLKNERKTLGALIKTLGLSNIK